MNEPFVWVVMPNPESRLDTDPYVFRTEKAARMFARLRGQDPDAVVSEEPVLNMQFVTESKEAHHGWSSDPVPARRPRRPRPGGQGGRT